jgi:hypothetical protein
LLSPLISHAELEGLKDLDDVGRLVAFWARLVDA